MKILSDYIEYLNDNPHGYWFKAKWYGWGWVPVRWQGWLVISLYLGIVMAPGILVAEEIKNGEEFLMLFPTIVFLATVVLIWICYRTGERPRWSWGRPRERKR